MGAGPGPGSHLASRCSTCGGDGKDWWTDKPCPACEGTGQERPEAFYHGAPTTERARILQHGLQPSNPAWSENWSGGIDPLERRVPNWSLENQPTGVYMTTNPNDTAAYGKGDIWKIDPEWANRQQLQPDNAWGNTAWILPNAVPPEALTLYAPLEHRPQTQHEWPNRPDSILEGPDPLEEAARARRLLDQHPEWGIGKPNHVMGARQHVLNYQPGPRAQARHDWGRGLVEDDGTIHTWREGYKEHAQYAEMVGADPYAAHRQFNIDPHGRFSLNGSLDESDYSQDEPMENYIHQETGLVPTWWEDNKPPTTTASMPRMGWWKWMGPGVPTVTQRPDGSSDWQWVDEREDLMPEEGGPPLEAPVTQLQQPWPVNQAA